MKLEDFLVKAKISTYASNGEGGEKKFKDGGRELTYKSGEWRYRDIYFGSSSFSGEEVVWRNKKVVWLMNYRGSVISKKVPTNNISTFLKKSLRLVKKNNPFRGPNKFQEGAWRYSNKNNGSVSGFFGAEQIYFKGKKVYELKYHGGKII